MQADRGSRLRRFSPPASANVFAFFRTLLERIRKHPGIESASMAEIRPGIGAGSSCAPCSFGAGVKKMFLG